MSFEFVLERLGEAWRRDRAADKCNADRLECARRQRFGGIAGPETVPIARYGDEPFDPPVTHEVVQLRALGVHASEIAAARTGVTRARPGFGEPRRKVLRIGTPIERAVRGSPNLPGRLRRRERPLEPRLLFATEQRHRGFVLAKVRHLRVAERNRIGRLPVVVPTAAIEYLHRFLREKKREVIGTEGVCPGLAARVFHRVAVVIGEYEV